MAQTYFFNIGILPVEDEDKKIEETDEIIFVLNILYTSTPLKNNDIDALPYDKKISQLHQCINFFINIYNANTGQSKGGDNFSFNKQKNDTSQAFKTITTADKYKLGIVCNGFYNNQLLLTKNSSETLVDEGTVQTLIGQLLFSLGYNIKCMAMINNDAKSFEDAFFKDEIILNEKAIPMLSVPIKTEITDPSGNYPTLNSIKNAVKYYYYTEIRTTMGKNYQIILQRIFNDIFDKLINTDIANYKKMVNKLCLIKKLLFTEATRGNQKIYILSVPCLKDIKTDDKPTFLILVDYFEKHIPEYIQIVNLLSKTTDDFELFSISGGGSKKRIPKRKYKYTRKLYK